MKTTLHLPLQIYCTQLLDIFQKSISTPNPALYLYQKNVRGPLFMAESIARILNNMYTDKEIGKAYKTFKKLEDVFGQIDYYDHLFIDFSKNKSINKTERDYFLKKRDKIIAKLNEKLREKAFYQDRFHVLINEFKINFNDKATILKLQEDIKTELQECADFFSKYPQQFDKMEKQVHEIRRKLRWISIYAQSLQGLIVLTADKKKHVWEKEFVTKEQIASPYGKLVSNKNFGIHIQFNQKAFYALNHVVLQLGIIKDKAFAIEALEKCIEKTSPVENIQALVLAKKQLKIKYNETDLLKEAHVLLEKYFVLYQIHKTLV
jgi:hypothetical protein